MKKLGIGFLVWIFLISQSFAASSLMVKSNSRLEKDLNLLHGFDLVKSNIVGQGPISRDEAVRLYLEAKNNFETVWQENEDISTILERVRKELASDLERQKNKKPSSQLHLLKTAHLKTVYLDSVARTIPTNNGIGAITASSHPFTQNDFGRNYTRGGQYAIETEHFFHLTPYFTGFVQPRFQMQFPTGVSDERVDAYVHEMFGDIQFLGMDIVFGRSSLLFGQGDHGGMLLSDNARPLDHMRLTNSHPGLLPWIFKYLGYQKITAFFGTLGPDSFFPYTMLAGYKWSIKPFSVWELGLSNMMMIGGEGAPDFGASNLIGDFFGFSATSEGKSNRIIGIDTRLTFPFLRNSQLYGEAVFDDKTVENFKRTFGDSSGYLLGFFIPRLDWEGDFSLRMEYRFLSELLYRHSQFLGGYTLNGSILGDALGPNGVGGRIAFIWNANQKTSFDLNLNYEKSDSNNYVTSGSDFLLTANGPSEYRYRSVAGVEHNFTKRLNVDLDFGYERVINATYLNGDDRNHFLVSVGLNLDTDDLFTVGK